MIERTNNLRGSVVMVLAVGVLALMDACMKTLSEFYPPVQVTALRALSSLPFISVWIGSTTGFRQLLRVRFGLHLLRAALGLVTLSSFIYGVRRLPLSETYAIFFAAPLFITAFGAMFLRERVEWQRWAAIVAGLGGVMIVLNPRGAGIATAAGLAILVSALGYALSAITTRVLGRTDSTQSMVFWLLTLMGAAATLLALPQWRPIAPAHWLVIAGMALTGSIGQWALTEAFKISEVSFIAPFEYTALVWGVGLDWALWQTYPGMRALAGATIVVLCGIELIRRERMRSQTA